jgi:hypothetical protein
MFANPYVGTTARLHNNLMPVVCVEAYVYRKLFVKPQDSIAPQMPALQINTAIFKNYFTALFRLHNLMTAFFSGCY